MKNILLASTALVAFAGAAAAEVSFSGEAVLGYNHEIEGGAYASVDLDVDYSQELDNGLTAAASFGFGVVDTDNTATGIESTVGLDAGDAEFSLSADAWSLNVGIDGGTDDATEVVWDGVSNMGNDSFYESADDNDEDVVRVEAALGAAEVVVAYNIDTEDFDAGVTAEFGDISVGAVYEEVGAETNFGLFGSATFAGATVDFAHSSVYDSTSTDNETSTGVEVTYPVGDVSVSAFYVSESDIDDSYGLTGKYSANGLAVKAFYHDGGDEDYGIEIGYDVSDVLSVYAGLSEVDGEYVGVEYDLGGGASLLASYGADDFGSNADSNDEIGPQEYNEGLTVELTLAF